VSGRAQPVGCGDHAGPESQYGMEQDHLGHLNTSNRTSCDAVLGPFLEPMLSLREDFYSPKESLRLIAFTASQHFSNSCLPTC
jgi:hypothetical protein